MAGTNLIILIISIPTIAFTINNIYYNKKLTYTILTISIILMLFINTKTIFVSNPYAYLNGEPNGYFFQILYLIAPGTWINSIIIYIKQKKEGLR